MYDKETQENTKKLLSNPKIREMLDPVLAGIDNQIIELKKTGATDEQILALTSTIIDLQKDKLLFPKEMFMEFLKDLLEKDRLK